MSDNIKAEKAAAYEAIARRAREDRLIAYCHTYEGDSTAHTLIRRLVEELAQARALLAAVRPVVAASLAFEDVPDIETERRVINAHETATRALSPAARAWAKGEA